MARVLIIDDYPDVADTYAHLLTMWGHETRAVYSGRTAVDVAAEFKPHVILLDIGLPGEDGYEIARQLRASQASSNGLRIIAISGFAGADDVQRAIDSGCDEHLRKPVKAETLKSLLANIA